jgi:hypothetical protein
MAIKKDALYEEKYNCLIEDLVSGYPPKDKGEEGAKMYVWNKTTKTLDSIFKKVLGDWYKL